MRLVTLELRAFGPFSERRLEFSKEASFNLVYGRNEAGKSSALRGILDLLFGVPLNTKDAHSIKMSDLRIAATLERDSGEQLSFVRRKGRLNTVLDEEQTPLGDDVLSPFLNDTSREMFTLLFGLDHDRLVSGGRSLLEGEGDLGRSLFGAGLGSSGLDAALRTLDKEADELFRPRGVHPHINAGLRSYERARREAKERSLSSESWNKLERQRREDTARRETLRVELRRVEQETAMLSRARALLPKLARLDAAREERMALADAVMLPADAAEERKSALLSLEQGEQALAQLRTEREALEKRLENIEAPPDVLACEDSINDLHERLAGYRQGLDQLRRSEEELADLEKQIELVKVSLPIEERPRVSRIARARILELVEREREVSGRLRRAKDDVARSESELGRLDVELEDAPQVDDVSELRAAVRAALRAGELESQLQDASEERARLSEHIQTQSARLGLILYEEDQLDLVAAGEAGLDLDALEKRPVPSTESIQTFKRREEALASERRHLEERRAEIKARHALLSRQVELLERDKRVPEPSELEAARRDRDSGWTLVRRAWLQGEKTSAAAKLFSGELPLHEAYERSLRRVDRVTDQLLEEADRVSQRSSLLSQLADLASQDKETGELLRELKKREERFSQEWSSAWASAGVEPRSPREMEDWASGHQRLLDGARKHRELGRREARLSARIDELKDAIARALGSLGAESPPDADASLGFVVEWASSYLERLETLAAERARLLERRAEVVDRRRRALAELERAEGELETWRVAYRESLSESGLDPKHDPASLVAVLDALSELHRLEDEQRRVARDRSAALSARTDFETQLARTEARLDSPSGGASPDETCSRLADRLKAAIRDQATKAQLVERAEGLAAQERAAQQRIAAARTELERLLRRAQVETVEALEDAEMQSALRAKVEQRIESLTEQLLESGEGKGLSALEASLRTVEVETLAERIAEGEAQAARLSDELSELDQSLGQAKAMLAQMDGGALAADSALEAELAASEVLEGVDRYVRLRLASSALRRHIERYREAHQGPLLSSASRLFERMTLSRFKRLLPSYLELDHPVLVAERADGSSVPVEGMSEGTRDQLFLALRLASLERHLEGGDEALPLIVDDILVNFDDERARATLEVLGELSARTQVLFFTHHKRLAELAEQAIDAERLAFLEL